MDAVSPPFHPGSRVRSGQTAAAFGLLMVLAIPGLGITLFFLAVLILQPRWN